MAFLSILDPEDFLHRYKDQEGKYRLISSQTQPFLTHEIYDSML